MALDSVTSPIMKLARKITPKTGIIDFSPIIALLSLEILKALWTAIFTQL
jgi:uncharacterized protein YggT (Ycf19 family)